MVLVFMRRFVAGERVRFKDSARVRAMFRGAYGVVAADGGPMLPEVWVEMGEAFRDGCILVRGRYYVGAYREDLEVLEEGE